MNFDSPLRVGVGETVTKSHQGGEQRQLDFTSMACLLDVIRHSSYRNMNGAEATRALKSLSGQHYAIIPSDLTHKKFVLLAGAWIKRYWIMNTYLVAAKEFWIGSDGKIHFKAGEDKERKLATLKDLEGACKTDGFTPLTAALLLDKIPQRGGWMKWAVALVALGVAAGVIYYYQEALLAKVYPKKEPVSTDGLLYKGSEPTTPAVKPTLTDRAKDWYNRLASSTSEK